MTSTPIPQITPAQREALHARGLTDEEMVQLTPLERQQFIASFTPEEGQKLFNGGSANRFDPAADRSESNPPATVIQFKPADRSADGKAAPTTDRSDLASVTELRLQLRRAGFHPIPVEGKRPVLKGWQQKFDVSEEEILRWEKTYPRARNTGVLAKFAPGLDVDITIEAAAKAAEDTVREFLEERGNIYVRFGNPPKRLIPLRTDEPFTKLSRVFIAPNGSKQAIEIPSDGQQYVVAGIHPKTGKSYAWSGGELTAIKRENLPYVRHEDTEQILDAIAKVLIEEHRFVLTSTSKTVDSDNRFDFTRENASSNGGEAAPELTVAPNFAELPVEDLGEGIETNRWWDRLPGEHKDAALDHGLEFIAKNSDLLKFGNNDNWYRIVTTVARSAAPHLDDIFIKHARTVPGADSEEELRRKLAYCKKNPRGITVGTFIKWAKQYGADFEPWLETYQSTIEPAKVNQQYEPVTRDTPELVKLDAVWLARIFRSNSNDE